MSSDSFSHRRGLALAVVLGVGIAGFHHSALARVSDQAGRLLGSVPTAAAKLSADDALLGQDGTRPDSAIIVADRHGDKDDDNDNGNGNDGNWNKSGHNGSGGNWNRNGNNNNWDSNNKNWNKSGGKNWSNNNHWGNNWNKNGGHNWSKNQHWDNDNDWSDRAYVRGWSRKPYYGDFFGGVVLGSILAATGVGVVPYSPDPELCWYWADPYMYRGYWDYCD